jgi:THO complex subunit 4
LITLIRISQPKSQPKPATAGKAITNGAATRGRGRGRGGRRGRNAGRGKPKTADELDAEMVDYFDAPGGVGGNAGTDATASNGIAPTATNGEDLGMDEISVRALSGSASNILANKPSTVNPWIYKG